MNTQRQVQPTTTFKEITADSEIGLIQKASEIPGASRPFARRRLQRTNRYIAIIEVPISTS